MTINDDLATLLECVEGTAYGMPRHRAALKGVEAEVARLRDGLRPFVEDYDFHAADYLADDSDARVFAARTVESLIEDQRKARALLAEDEK